MPHDNDQWRGLLQTLSRMLQGFVDNTMPPPQPPPLQGGRGGPAGGAPEIPDAPDPSGSMFLPGGAELLAAAAALDKAAGHLMDVGGGMRQSLGDSAKQLGGTDTIPAMLSPGEFVVNPKSTSANLGLLNQINQSHGPVRHFASGGLASLRDHGLEALQTQKFGALGSSMMGAIGDVGGMLPGPVGSATKAVAKFGQQLFEAVDKLRDWTKNLHDANMQFAEFSAAMASVQAQQEVRDIQRSRERGDRRAASAEYLAEGSSRLEDQLAGWEDIAAILQNDVGGAISNVGADIMEFFQPLRDAILEWLNAQQPQKPKNEGLAEWMDKMGQRQWTEVYGRPARFGRFRGMDPFK